MLAPQMTTKIILGRSRFAPTYRFLNPDGTRIWFWQRNRYLPFAFSIVWCASIKAVGISAVRDGRAFVSFLA